MDRVGIESEKKVTSWMGICLPRQQSKHNHIQMPELSCEWLKLEWSVVFVLVVGHMGLNVLVANHFHTELLSGIKNAPLRGGLKKLIKFSIKGWVGGSGGGQILLKKNKNHAFKIHFRPF